MRDRDHPGVPLAHYLEHHPHHQVRFICQACARSFDVPTRQVVDQLIARGLGDERTGVRELAKLLARRCTRCDARRWETRPAYYPPPKS